LDYPAYRQTDKLTNKHTDMHIKNTVPVYHSLQGAVTCQFRVRVHVSATESRYIL